MSPHASGHPTWADPSRIPPHRIVKVGGSLFTTSTLAERLDNWCRHHPWPGTTWWLAGGGKLAEVLRRWDDDHGTAARADSAGRPPHWQTAVLKATCHCLQATTTLLAALRHIPGPSATDHAPRPGTDSRTPGVNPLPPGAMSEICMDPWQLVQNLPSDWHANYRLATWDATTDTLAALAARQLHAHTLILLKACPVPRRNDQEDADAYHRRLADLGIVDSVFPSAASALPEVRIEKLP